uniref:Uncharacterized protein n=1 Tax=Steinernema glaseri TaxID=37863 RepID=A0A1I8AJB7_9BILA
MHKNSSFANLEPIWTGDDLITLYPRLCRPSAARIAERLQNRLNRFFREFLPAHTHLNSHPSPCNLKDVTRREDTPGGCGRRSANALFGGHETMTRTGLPPYPTGYADPVLSTPEISSAAFVSKGVLSTRLRRSSMGVALKAVLRVGGSSI